MGEELDNSIKENAAGPRKASGDSGSVEQHSLADQIAADKYLESKQASRVDICIIGPGAGWHPEPPDKLNPAAALDDAQAELAPIYHLVPLVLPGMYEREWGRIVGISLAAAFSSPAYAYNVAKAARTQALLAMRGEAWEHGVTVSVIAPGPVGAIDDLAQTIELCDHGPAWKARANVTPQDIAEGVAMLCSDAGRFISGAELPFMFH